jgi:1,4-dihydroxy-6-naphthoate synthase
VPALRSTAYLLFRLWAAGQDVADVEVLPFGEIMPGVRDGVIDAGLVIHEARFTYPSFGLRALADLGTWWEEDTGLPIPLGAIVARRSLDTAALAERLRASLEYAWRHPGASARYVAAHAKEMDPAVQAQHIRLYVNELTRDLGEEGYAAVRALLGRAAAAGLVPPLTAGALS